MPRLKKSFIKSFNKGSACKNLRALRITKGFTQLDVSIKLGISQNAYSKTEMGRTQITLDALILLSLLYEMELENVIIAVIPKAGRKFHG